MSSVLASLLASADAMDWRQAEKSAWDEALASLKVYMKDPPPHMNMDELRTDATRILRRNCWCHMNGCKSRFDGTFEESTKAHAMSCLYVDRLGLTPYGVPELETFIDRVHERLTPVVFPFIMERLTEAEHARLEHVLHTHWPRDTIQNADSRIQLFMRYLQRRKRVDFVCASMGQLPLPAVLVQLVGQFHSSEITPSRPAPLRPPSYLARVAAIRAELDADPSTGETRAASQMESLERVGKRARL